MRELKLRQPRVKDSYDGRTPHGVRELKLGRPRARAQDVGLRILPTHPELPQVDPARVHKMSESSRSGYPRRPWVDPARVHKMSVERPAAVVSGAGGRPRARAQDVGALEGAKNDPSGHKQSCTPRGVRELKPLLILEAVDTIDVAPLTGYVN